jgi:uncharacterized protein
MRLTEEQINTLKEALFKIDKEAALYLFGSRTDDEKRGGDIDLLIISEKVNRKDVWNIKDTFFDRYGEQKMDIVIDDGSLSDPFKKKAFKEAVKL